MDEKCNGWSNRETWLVSLWFSEIIWADKEDGATITGEYIRGLVEGAVESAIRGPGQSDMLGGFIWDMLNLGAVDWAELARHYEE